MGNISAVLKPRNISLLRQYLGGYALYKSLVGVGNSLEEVGNDAEHSTVLQPSNISFLIQYLGGYGQLYEALVGVGNGLEEVGNDGGTLLCFATTKQYKLSFTIPGRPRAAR